ncbi:histone methylation protein DOT1-domain-containing protein [Desarmillaria tabescens]|uniref:Histone-lysine N-methyltransferase, H3 lysine-79 specific n=1 Tax=Armillaria tabescens TaxID=1929756 RepID=A0AA39JAK1_ARMTA|nr:histone methylation protein DOT1-domain-containing protein [Desarmillaria tabescens]KAK0439088.1 histone methylation protein DOT1-domain-containing protein [Desarmillaria tabescens]
MNDINCALESEKINPLSDRIIEHIIEQSYSRRILTMAPKLNLGYKPWSSETYGELLPTFISKISQICHIQKSSLVLDLGCGTANVLCQIAISHGCRTYGIEVRNVCVEGAHSMISESQHRLELWGSEMMGSLIIEHANMLESTQLLQLLSEADLIIMNNFQFDPELIQSIKELIQNANLKEGAHIFSMKSLIRQCKNGKMTERDFSVPMREFRQVMHYYPPESVSWTESKGIFYILKKDTAWYRKKEAEFLNMKETSKRKGKKGAM